MICLACSKDLGGPDGKAICPDCAKAVLAVSTRTVPISDSEFRHEAKPITVTIAGIPMSAPPREFNTGSLGWWAGGKININVAERLVRCQVTCSVTVIGSKKEAKE